MQFIAYRWEGWLKVYWLAGAVGRRLAAAAAGTVNILILVIWAAEHMVIYAPTPLELDAIQGQLFNLGNPSTYTDLPSPRLRVIGRKVCFRWPCPRDR